MGKAIITYDEEGKPIVEKIIEIPDSIIKLYKAINEEAGVRIENFKNELSKNPNKPIIEDLSPFDCLDTTEQEEEDEEIVDNYFYKKGEELFGKKAKESVIEYYNVSEEQKEKGIDISLLLIYFEL